MRILQNAEACLAVHLKPLHCNKQIANLNNLASAAVHVLSAPMTISLAVRATTIVVARAELLGEMAKKT
jgi:hypothetical protein